MIGGLMYLTASRPDIAFATFVCVRYQERPTEKHLKEVKRIFRYLRQSINKGLWYSNDSEFELIVYSDSDLAGCLDDYKSISRGLQFLGDKLVSWDQVSILAKDKGFGQEMHQSEETKPLYGVTSLKDYAVTQILLDHPLSYALTATADVLDVYLQQFWKIVRKVPDTKDTIIFKLDSQEIIYTVDMFRDTLQLPVETPDNPFIAPVNIEIIESFMNRVGYQGVVDKDFMNNVFQNKDVIQYPRFTKLIITVLMKKYPSISSRLEEDYHSIKDDTSLVSVYTIGNVQVQGMLIPNTFLTEEICATDNYKEYETVGRRGSKVLERRVHQENHSNLPSDKRIQEKLAEEEIEKMVEGEEDDKSYASEFADSMINDDVDDSGNRIEPRSHKENPKVVFDDDVNDKQKQDESKDDNESK
ncbi:hypothetical protein Tco_1338242 [Tanacetum coccineum]